MTGKAPITEASVPLSRRELINSGLGMAALAVASAEPAAAAARAGKTASARAPFDSLRDYIRALDERGLVVRIPRVDQT